ncbi:cutinase family protein [Corynebacterium aquatimens]|nr:cutinase family protein [Corynebacterium aquatimens]
MPSCAPVEVIQAAGTGFSHSWHPDARTTLFDDSSSPADDLQQRFGAQRVRHYQVKYPATLGRVSALASAGVGVEGTEAATYGESVTIGRDDAILEMQTVTRHCPGTKFVLVGYSQGAHLIGDAAALVGAGKVPGVTADNIAAVVLFADPGRAPLAGGGAAGTAGTAAGAPAAAGTADSPALAAGAPTAPSRLYGPPPAGIRAANFETVQSGAHPRPHPRRHGRRAPRQLRRTRRQGPLPLQRSRPRLRLATRVRHPRDRRRRCPRSSRRPAQPRHRHARGQPRRAAGPGRELPFRNPRFGAFAYRRHHPPHHVPRDRHDPRRRRQSLRSPTWRVGRWSRR